MQSSILLPNIVFITTDTQGREMLSCYVDRPGVETPFLDQLASESVLFENAYVTSPVCTPSRASWYTGCHPNRNGAWANEMTIGQHIPMLGDLLRSQGYETAHIGKWHLDGAGYNGAGKADGGFNTDHWYYLSNFLDEVGHEGINKFGGWNLGLDDIDFCFAHRIADRAIRYIEQSQDKVSPFFLAIEFDEPHGPYICPPPFRGKFSQDQIYRPATFMSDLQDKPRMQQEYAAYLATLRESSDTFPHYYHHYYDCNSYVDFEIGRILQAIERICEAETVIIFTSDHGDHVGSFGLCAKGPTMYNTTTAVPLIIKAPQLTSGNRRENGLVSSVDVTATILDLAQISTPDTPIFSEQNGYDFRSLLPVIRQETDKIRDAVFMEFNRFGKQFEQIEGLYPIRCVVTSNWKLSINLFDRDELYDQIHDPLEAYNRIDDPSLGNIRADLHDLILDWQERTQDVFRGKQWYERSWRPDKPYHFFGFSTTGYADKWQNEHFSKMDTIQ